MKAIAVLLLCACESSVPIGPPVVQPAIAPVAGAEQLSMTGSLPDVATTATGDAIAIWREVPARDRHRLVVRRRHAGVWTRAETIAAPGAGEVFWPRVQMTEDGRAIAVWQQLDIGADREPTDHGVWAAQFDPASGWTAAARIGEHSDSSVIRGSSVRLAIGPDGSAVAVWPLRRAGSVALYASTYQRGGWAPPVAIDSDPGDAMLPQVAFDRGGHALAVWVRANHVWSARLVANHWTKAAPVEREDGGTRGAIELTVADDGTAIAIWERRYGRSMIESATFHPDRGWSQPEAVQTDAGEGTSPRLAGDIAIWVSRTSSGDELWSRPHTAAGWGPARRLAATWPDELLVARASGGAVVVQRDHAGCATLSNIAADGTWGRATPFASCSQAFSDAVAASSDVMVAWSHGDGVWMLASPLAAVAPPVVAPKPDDGRAFAIVQVMQRIDECSGAGGEHYVLALDGEKRLAHAGGHDVKLDLISQRFMVAELILYPPRDPDRDGNPDSSRSGWCLDKLPRFDAVATRLLPARDAADARRLLEQVERLGMPPSTTTLTPTSADEEIAIARVVDVGTSVELESIEGRAPRRIAVPAETLPIRGDVVVVATSAGTPTRVLFPEDLASARRWASEIRSSRWPVDPIVIPHALTAARWTTVGKVVTGRKACGPTIRAPHGYGSPLMLPLDAPAPAGTKLGDRLIAVMIARATPDACGHTARVIRAYPAPAGVTLDSFRGVIPSGLTPIVE